jgi:hypothetical protein
MVRWMRLDAGHTPAKCQTSIFVANHIKVTYTSQHGPHLEGSIRRQAMRRQRDESVACTGGRLQGDSPNPTLLHPIGHLLQLGRGAPEPTYRFAVPGGRLGHVVRFVADINASGIGMHHLQTEVIALNFPHHFPPLLSVHLVPIALRWAAGCLLAFLRLFGFHANLPMLNSTWPGPVGETCSISPAGSAPYPFQDRAATIDPIANTGAMLLYRAKRSRVHTALAAEPCCVWDSNCAKHSTVT